MALVILMDFGSGIWMSVTIGEDCANTLCASQWLLVAVVKATGGTFYQRRRGGTSSYDRVEDIEIGGEDDRA